MADDAARTATVSMWPTTVEALIERQLRLGALADEVEAWRPPSRALRVAAVFCAFPTGLAGPGAAGDPVWTAAVVWEGGAADAACRPPASGRVVAETVELAAAGAPYVAGLLGLRVGEAMERAVRGAVAQAAEPDLVLVDATGRDHPRGAGLALHLGAVLELPSVGVTNRTLLATFDAPEDRAGAASELRLGERVVGFALRSRVGANPVIVHAGWRTDALTALAVVRRLTGRWRTPEPLRVARHVARVARARAEGRYPGW